MIEIKVLVTNRQAESVLRELKPTMERIVKRMQSDNYETADVSTDAYVILNGIVRQLEEHVRKVRRKK